MNIVIAPDSYKGSLSAEAVGKTIARAMMSAMPHIVCDVVPMADGGEGTLDALLFATGGHSVTCEVMGPLLTPVEAKYGVLGDGKTVVVEMAQAAGLPLLTMDERNPMMTSTYGVGQLLRHALDEGFRNFVIGIGGSATNDGGLGFLNALGAKFFDESENPIPPTGYGMTKVRQVRLDSLDPRLQASTIRVACDVDNPLTGANGASAIFGPQKGADTKMVQTLDEGLQHYALMIESSFHCPNLANQSGAGAAGGLGFALMALGAQLVSGASVVGDACGLAHRIRKADLVITGEGRSDHQTLSGKVPFAVAQIAQQLHKPAVLISGSFDPSCQPLQDHFLSVHAASCGPLSLEEAMKQAESNLYTTALNVAKLIQLSV